MTGREAWSLVAPIIAPHGGDVDGSFNLLDEAYVIVYSALKYWDEHKDQEGEST